MVELEEKIRIASGLQRWIEINEKSGFEDIQRKLLMIKEDFEDQLMLMVSGEFNAGKSTFINAILGEELLTVDITPATATITKLTYGDKKRIVAHYNDGSKKDYDWSWIENLTAERKGKAEKIRNQLSYVEYQLPFEFLKTYTLIDSPGLTALHAHHTKVTENFMERSEAGIWLFNAMSVGTASELEWLNKMHNLKIPTLGVVNAIDRLDEEEDLQEFLEYNERRLSPLVNKLYGVSAQEILKGKLENNQELLDWGNAEVIQELLRDIGSVNERKIESFYRKAHSILKDFQHQLLETRSGFGRMGDPVNLKVFKDISYPTFKTEIRIFNKFVKNHKVLYEEWSSVLKQKDISVEYVSTILNRLGNPPHLTEMWNKNIKSKIDLWQTNEYKLYEQKAELIIMNNKLEKAWSKLSSKLPAKIEFAEEERVLAKKVNSYNKEIQILRTQKLKVIKEIEKFDKQLTLELQKKFLGNINKSNPVKRNLENILKSFKEQMGLIRSEDLKNMENHLDFYSESCLILNQMLKSNDPKTLQSKEYKRVQDLLNKINSVYNTEIYKSFFIQLKSMNFYKIEKLHAAEWKFDLANKLRYSSKQLNKLPVNIRISDEEARSNDRTYEKRNNSLIMASIFIPIGAVIFFGMLQDTDNYSSNSQYNSEYYTQDTNTENYVDSEVEEAEVETLDPEVKVAGVENETVEIIEEQVEEEQVEEDSYEFDNAEIEIFFQDYRNDYMTSLNNGTVKYLSRYMDVNEDLYIALSDFIYENSNSENYYEFESNEIVSIERGDFGEYFVIAHETFYLYGEDESESFHTRTKKYKLITSLNDTLQIEGYETLDKTTEILTAAVEEESEGIKTVQLVSKEQISNQISSYYKALEVAFNGSGFDQVNSYLLSNSEDYALTEKYIEKALNENMLMINNEFIVENVEEYDQDHYLVTVYFEDEYQYQSGAGDIKEARAQYLVKVTEYGDMLIEEMVSLDILNEYEY